MTCIAAQIRRTKGIAKNAPVTSSHAFHCWRKRPKAAHKRLQPRSHLPIGDRNHLLFRARALMLLVWANDERRASARCSSFFNMI
jgi:hypothetical protein